MDQTRGLPEPQIVQLGLDGMTLRRIYDVLVGVLLLPLVFLAFLAGACVIFVVLVARIIRRPERAVEFD